MDRQYVIGVDFGSDSARAIVVDACSAEVLAEASMLYPRWEKRKYCDSECSQYRQHPKDYLEGAGPGGIFREGEDRRHRRGYDWFYRVPGGRRRHAAGYAGCLFGGAGCYVSYVEGSYGCERGERA